MSEEAFKIYEDTLREQHSRGEARRIRIVGDQHKWDSLGPERSEVWKSLGELPEGPVMESSPVDSLSLHIDGCVFADY